MDKKHKILGKTEHTYRGFEFIGFKDRYDTPCSLQASSLADYEQPGISAVWLGDVKARMHLDRKQVEALITHLTKWLKDGTFEVD